MSISLCLVSYLISQEVPKLITNPKITPNISDENLKVEKPVVEQKKSTKPQKTTRYATTKPWWSVDWWTPFKNFFGGSTIHYKPTFGV